MGKENVAANWRYLFEHMTSVVSGLREIDPASESAPVSRLQPHRDTLALVQQRLRSASISRLGDHNIQREVAVAQNTLTSIESALEDGDLSESRFSELLTDVAARVERLTQEIAVHVDFRTLEHQASTYERKATNAQPHGGSSASMNESLAAAGRAQTFSSFTDAMTQVLKHVEEEEASNPVQTVTAQNASLTEVRERHLFEQVGAEFSADLQRLNAKLRTFQPSAEAPFLLVHAPVIVISNKRISEQNLKSSGIDFKVVPFTGIQHGVTPGGRSEQMDTFGLILRSQLMAAFSTKLKPAASSRARGAGKGAAAQGLSDSLDPELTRAQLSNILRLRTGRAYVDVLAGVGRTAAIVNRKLPGFRFVWLLPQDQYKRIGHLSLQEVGLPFRD